jgi:hypothetical protein
VFTSRFLLKDPNSVLCLYPYRLENTPEVTKPMSKLRYDRWSVGQFVLEAIWGLLPDFYYCQIIEGLLMWGALSDKKAGLSLQLLLVSPAQSRVRVPWDSRPYFTVTNSILLFVASYDLVGYGGGIRPRLHTGLTPRQSI